MSLLFFFSLTELRCGKSTPGPFGSKPFERMYKSLDPRPSWKVDPQSKQLRPVWRVWGKGGVFGVSAKGGFFNAKGMIKGKGKAWALGSGSFRISMHFGLPFSPASGWSVFFPFGFSQCFQKTRFGSSSKNGPVTRIQGKALKGAWLSENQMGHLEINV